MERSLIKDAVGCSVDRGDGVMEMASIGKCTYNFQLHENMEAYLRGDAPLDKWSSENIVTNQGKNLTNDVMFGTTSKIATWYILIFSTNTTCVVGMTYGTPVFTEFTTYTENNRPEYTDVPSASQIMTNVASRAVFTIDTGGTATIYGAGLVGGTNAATKGNATASGNYLYSASLFGTAKSVVPTNVLSVDISITQS